MMLQIDPKQRKTIQEIDGYMSEIKVWNNSIQFLFFFQKQISLCTILICLSFTTEFMYQ
jgi:hypothetical protein